MIMGMFTKKLADWNLIDCIKMTIGTIGVLYVLDKVYDKVQERHKVNNDYDDAFDDDVYVQEEETPE
jgi:hypothetical protein